MDRDLIVGLLDSEPGAISQGLALLLRQTEALSADVHALKTRVADLEKVEPPRYQDVVNVFETRTGRILTSMASTEARLLRMEKTTSRIHLIYQAIGAGTVALAIELLRLWGKS